MSGAHTTETWHLQLLGQPSLTGTRGEVTVSDNTMAVLAHLALEGTTPKYQLAGWLWPETSEENARANMRKLLQRLRKLTGTDLVLGEDQIRLSERVEVDVVRLEALALTSQQERPLNLQGTLLLGLEFDHAPDFEEWLLSARERVDGLRRKVVVAQLEHLERHGQLSEALELAQWATQLDPLSEEAHRRVMRLAYLLGDRGAALATYQRCREVLLRELNTEPLPETVQLAALIESGGTVAATAPAERRSIPLAILRPPLTGREREWASMEEAWRQGQPMFLSGAPGVGKSRLMHEFAASRGTFMLAEGRPGDPAVPFSSLSRGYRAFFERFPEVRLEPWVRREVSRLVPSLSDAPPPIQTPEEKLRFHDAIFELHRVIAATVDVILMDDVSFFDASSFETASAATYRMTLEGLASRAIGTFRTGELEAGRLEQMRQLAEQGLVCLIELEPLSGEATASLLSRIQLEGTDLSALAENLHRAAGGNPLFMLETIKDLFESDQLGPHLPARLPLPEKVHALIRRRFERLSPTASRVAQAAAVLQSDFDLDLIGAMLGATPMDLLEPWEELEAAQVLSGPRFSHDLVYESVRASLSAPVRAFMHRRAAEVLEAGGVRGARVARHWLAGQETARAAQHLLEAAARAVDGLRLHEAANFFDQAADALEAQGDLGAAFEARVSALRQRLEVDVGERTEAASKRLLALARTPRQRAQARLVQAMLLSTRGRFAQIEAVARSGLEDAVIAEDLQLEADLLEAAATVPMTLGRPEEAIPTIERMVEIYRALEHPLGLATATLGLGLARRRFDRLEALRHFREAHRLAARANLPNEQASALNNIARTSAEIGWVDQALEAYTRAGDLLRSTGGAVDTQLVSLTGLARARLLAGDYAGALEATREALTLGEGRQFAWLGMIHLVRAQILHGVGDAEGARRELGIALGWAGFPSYNRALLSLVRAELEPEFNLAAVLPEVEASRDGVLIGHYRLIEAQRLPPEAALESLRVALEVATDQHLGGMRAAVLARRAQVLLTLGQPDAAIKAALEALELNRTFTPPLEQPELRLTHHRVLAAMHAQNAPEPLEPLRAGMTWLSDTMHRVPPEFRQGFLERNPVNRTFLETARQFGLEVSVPD